MKLKGVVFEDFANYKKPSMFLITSKCDWKCCKDLCIPINVCQNSSLISEAVKDYSPDLIYKAYLDDDITLSLIFGGLEPMDQFDEMIDVIHEFRSHGCDDTIVIYTGYNESEIVNKTTLLSSYKNIIVKFGRYIPNSQSRYDELLGVTLASDNQYAKQIS